VNGEASAPCLLLSPKTLCKKYTKFAVLLLDCLGKEKMHVFLTGQVIKIGTRIYVTYQCELVISEKETGSSLHL
jgi:hypothetical protein